MSSPSPGHRRCLACPRPPPRKAPRRGPARGPPPTGARDFPRRRGAARATARRATAGVARARRRARGRGRRRRRERRARVSRARASSRRPRCRARRLPTARAARALPRCRRGDSATKGRAPSDASEAALRPGGLPRGAPRGCRGAVPPPPPPPRRRTTPGARPRAPWGLRVLSVWRRFSSFRHARARRSARVSSSLGNGKSSILKTPRSLGKFNWRIWVRNPASGVSGDSSPARHWRRRFRPRGSE